MNKKLCKDCGYFKDDLLAIGKGWCCLDGAEIDEDDTCKNIDMAKDAKKLILNIERILGKVDEDE